MYTVRKFTDEEKELSAQIWPKFEEIEKLLDTLPNSREKSIAYSHIEDAMLHANVAIAERTEICNERGINEHLR